MRSPSPLTEGNPMKVVTNDAVNGIKVGQRDRPHFEVFDIDAHRQDNFIIPINNGSASDATDQAIVLRIQKMWSALHLSLSEIARQLNQEGIPQKRGEK